MKSFTLKPLEAYLRHIWGSSCGSNTTLNGFKTLLTLDSGQNLKYMFLHQSINMYIYIYKLLPWAFGEKTLALRFPGKLGY